MSEAKVSQKGGGIAATGHKVKNSFSLSLSFLLFVCNFVTLLLLLLFSVQFACFQCFICIPPVQRTVLFCRNCISMGYLSIHVQYQASLVSTGSTSTVVHYCKYLHKILHTWVCFGVSLGQIVLAFEKLLNITVFDRGRRP